MIWFVPIYSRETFKAWVESAANLGKIDSKVKRMHSVTLPRDGSPPSSLKETSV